MEKDYQKLLMRKINVLFGLSFLGGLFSVALDVDYILKYNFQMGIRLFHLPFLGISCFVAGGLIFMSYLVRYLRPNIDYEIILDKWYYSYNELEWILEVERDNRN